VPIKITPYFFRARIHPTAMHLAPAIGSTTGGGGGGRSQRSAGDDRRALVAASDGWELKIVIKNENINLKNN
jgi:hypothetical protein